MNSNTRRLRNVLSILCGAAAILWPIVAPILAGCGVFSVGFEVESYQWSLMAGILAAVGLFVGDGSRKQPVAKGTFAAIAIAVPMAFPFFSFGNGLFLKASAHRLGAEEWKGVAIAIESLSANKQGAFSENVEVNALPAVLRDKLWSSSDYKGGYIGRRINRTEVEARFMYGPKSRRWGIVYGEQVIQVPNNLSSRRTIQVLPNLLLFVGVD